MNIEKLTAADHVDIHRKLLFVSMFLLSLVFGLKTWLYIAGNHLKDLLKIMGFSLFILAFIMLAITLFWKVRYIARKDRFRLLHSADSFVNQVMNRACKISWVSTLVSLFLVSSLIQKNSFDLPGQFYVDLSVFLLLITFSVSFFILFQGVGDDNQINEV